MISSPLSTVSAAFRSTSFEKVLRASQDAGKEKYATELIAIVVVALFLFMA